MNANTKTIMNISVLTFLLMAASSRCCAEIVIEDVSTNRAKELGVTIRTNMNGQAGIQVEMEFKTVGELKKITYAELQIGDGENRIMSAPLRVSYPSPDRATVRFSAYPAYVPKSTLMIAVYGGPKGDVGYRFKVKDFIEHEGPAPIIDRAAEAEAKAKREPKSLAAEALRPADLLKVLRARDAQFDNVKLDYVTTAEITTKPFPAWKYPEIAKMYHWENEKPEVIPFRYNENLIARGQGVTFIRVLDPTYPEKKSESTRHMTPYQKWSNVGGVARQITRNAESGRGHATMNIRPGGAPVDMAQEQAMEVEFVHGFGFGKRIKQVDRIERDGPRLKVDGTVQIWWEDISRFQLVLDEHFLVRQAAIQSNVKGYRTDFEVKTEGSVTAEGFEFAKSGSFKRIVLGMEVEGTLTAKPRIQKEFQAEFKGVQFHLSDARYEELVAMIPDPGTQVFDHVSDKVYFVGEEDKARPLLPPPDPPNVVRAKDFEDSGTVEKAKNAAAGPVEREPLPLDEAKAVAAKFEDLRLGLSPEQVQRALGLETVAGRMLRYEGIADYEGSPRQVGVCVLRDGYAFTLTYVESVTNGPSLSEWLWRPDLDWPKGTANLKQSLASLGNPLAGTRTLLLHGFAVDVNTNSFMPVAATVFIDAGRFEDVKKRQAQIEQSIRGRLAGLTKQDLSAAATSTAIQLDIRSALNSAMPGHPIRYVSLKLDVK